MKKTPGDDIILLLCTTNDNHMMYGSWDMMCDEQNFLSFWAIVCPFTPLTMQKIKNFQKWKKKHLEISAFYTSVPQIMIICYTALEMWHVMDVIVIFHSRLFFALLPPAPLPPLTTQKIKFLKNEKKIPEISSFYTCVPKIMIRWCTGPKIWRMKEGQTDKQMEKVTCRGGCPAEKFIYFIWN